MLKSSQWGVEMAPGIMKSDTLLFHQEMWEHSSQVRYIKPRHSLTSGFQVSKLQKKLLGTSWQFSG